MAASAKTEQSSNIAETDFFSSNNNKDPQEMLRALMSLIEASKRSGILENDSAPQAIDQTHEKSGDKSVPSGANNDADAFILGIIDHMLASLEHYRERKRSYGG